VDQEQELTRRRVVSVGATAAAGAVGLATLTACGSDDSADAGSASGTSSAATPSASASGDAASGDSGGPALAKVADVPVGGAIAAKGSDGKPIIIAQPESGKVVAFSAICTHQGCTVAPKGESLDCPCHGSKYKTTDGSVLNGPATKPLPAVSVSVSGDSIVAG
jgi:cytochrome b6-f complex iron-sulfur subunit